MPNLLPSSYQIAGRLDRTNTRATCSHIHVEVLSVRRSAHGLFRRVAPLCQTDSRHLHLSLVFTSHTVAKRTRSLDTDDALHRIRRHVHRRTLECVREHTRRETACLPGLLPVLLIFGGSTQSAAILGNVNGALGMYSAWPGTIGPSSQGFTRCNSLGRHPQRSATVSSVSSSITIT